MTNKIKTSPNDDFGALVEESLSKIPKVGDLISGKVISVSKSEIKIDLSGVMTGVVRGRELYFESPEYSKLKPGDTIEATVLELENENGEIEMSFKQAGQEKAWKNLLETYEKSSNINVKVVDANKGGLLVNYLQISGFLPVSQLSPENYPRISGGDKMKILEKLRSLVGKELEVKISNFDQDEQKLIFSEKDAWQEKQRDIISKYKTGSVVKGIISAITNFGVFIGFDDLEGLIHISELSWQRIDNLNKYYKVGDEIEAEIVSMEGSKIFLSAKRLIKDPWLELENKYKIGQEVKGTIIKINHFGLFVEIEKNVNALAHYSQLDLAPGQKMSSVYKIGDIKDFKVISFEPNEHRLGLSAIKKTDEKEAEKDEEKNN